MEAIAAYSQGGRGNSASFPVCRPWSQIPKQLVEEQEGIYVAIAVALCCIVLMLTMDSIPASIDFPAAASAFPFSGTWARNYFMGEISYITKAVAAVLQLGCDAGLFHLSLAQLQRSRRDLLQ